MTHIPSAAPPREVTGGAPAKQTTTSPSTFNATFEASLITTPTTQDAEWQYQRDAQDVRTFAQRQSEHEAGVTRLATVTELASAELATSTYQPAQPPAQRPAHLQPGGAA